MTDPADASSLTLVGHLTELRSRLIRVFLALFVGAVVAFFFRDQMLDLLQRPYNAVSDKNLIVTGPTEPFSIAMRMSLFGGAVLASPVIAYQAWVFINPGLTSRERKWAFPIVAAMVSLFGLGVGFAYWSMERALGFLLTILEGLDTLVTVDAYTRFTIRFLLLFGISFQFPVFLFAAAAAGALSSARLAAGRRWAVLIIVTVGAVLTPTGDPLTLLLLSIPLYLLYEATIWLVRLILKK